ncbi:MAG: ABC transporter permease [Candidatus Hydrogenedentes bacterium]|nr:ABC transporter permease [Candidatus Hydrogenedentota bacterium]
MAKELKQGYWRIVWRQFRRNWLAMLGLVLILAIGIIALLAPFLAGDIPIYLLKDGKSYWFPNLITYSDLQKNNLYDNFDRWKPGPGDYIVRPPVPYGPLRQDLFSSLKPPSKAHWLGTDNRGRDVLSRMIWGAQISMAVGFVAMGIAVIIGLIMGALAGYYGGWVDAIVLRLIEIVLTVPTFFLVLIAVAMLQPSIYNIMAVIGMTGWPGIARLVRGEMLKQRQQDYTTAATASGLRNTRIIFRHLLPNAVSPVFVAASFGVAGAILTETGLSFLGFGVPAPTASWGELLNQSRQYVLTAWWLVTFPGVAIFVTVTAFNLIGDGLRDAMDPRLRQ